MAAFDTQEDKLITRTPDRGVDVRETFGIDFDMKVPAFSVTSPCTVIEEVPALKVPALIATELEIVICAELALNVPVETLSRPLTFHVPEPALRIGRPVPPACCE